MSQVIYEVNLTVEGVIADEFAGWLHPHIQAMVNLRGFMEAQWFEGVPGAPQGTPMELRLSYSIAIFIFGNI